jgi:hypothetical protein
VVSDVARAVTALFDKVFEILDFSFVVSGATLIAALAWDPRTSQLDIPRLVQGPLGIAILLVAAHTSGLACFAAGRLVRRLVTTVLRRPPPLAQLFAQLIRHGVIAERNTKPGEYRYTGKVDVPWLARYVEPVAQPDALYARMWAEVRQQERLLPSFSLVRRYWVFAATLDGLFVALLVWSCFLFPWPAGSVDVGYLPSALTLAGACVCLWEARRYAKYQVEEIVGTVVHAYDPTGAVAAHGESSTSPRPRVHEPSASMTHDPATATAES